MIVAIDGSIRSDKEAVISVCDHGFLYGIGLFETFRTYGGRPFLLGEHLLRLSQGCEALGIRYRPDESGLRGTILLLLETAGLDDAYIRLSVSAGVGEVGLPAGAYERPTEIVYAKPLPTRDERLYTEGRSLQLLRHRRNSPEGTVRFKSFHYMNNILAKRELDAYPWARGAEGLMLNDREQLTEGVVSNLFFVRDGALHTPAADTGILPGITRAAVLSLAEKLGLPTAEGHFGWDALLGAEEAFLTNSIQEIVPVARLIDVDGTVTSVGTGAMPDAEEAVSAGRSDASRAGGMAADTRSWDAPGTVKSTAGTAGRPHAEHAPNPGAASPGAVTRRLMEAYRKATEETAR